MKIIYIYLENVIPHKITMKSKLINVNKTLTLYLVHNKGTFCSLQNPTSLGKYKNYKKFPFEANPIVEPNIRPESE